MNKKYKRSMRALRSRSLTALLAFGAALWAASAHAAGEKKFPDVGNHLPPLKLLSTGGEAIGLDWDTRAPKATILFFFEPRSAEGFRELSFADMLMRRGSDFGLEVYAVEGSGLQAGEIDERLERYRSLFRDPSFPIVSDPDYLLSSRFTIKDLPTTFLIESHGVVLGRSEGFGDIDVVDLARKVERLLGVEKGFFSPDIRETGIDENAERYLEGTLQAGGAVEEEDRPIQSVSPGDSGLAFDFTDLSGRKRRWEAGSMESKVTVVFFWGALCLPCIQEMAFLQEVYAVAKPYGLEVLAVESSGLSPERIATVMKRYTRFHPEPTYPVVPDPDFAIGQLFDVTEDIPQTFFLGSDGRLIYHTGDFIQGDEAGLTRKIEMALGLEDGAIERLEGSSSAPPAEAPSIRIRSEGEEEFRSNLVSGDTYYRNWEFAKALPHYKRCVELEPKNTAVWVKVAKTLERLGELEEALAAWNRILRLDPSHPEATSRVEVLSGS